MKSFRILAGAACLGVSALLAAGCSSSSSAPAAAAGSATSAAAGATAGSATTSGAPAAASITVSSTSTSLGTVLTGPNGLTLYRFDPDTTTTSACTGGCAKVWPPVTGMPTAGSGVIAADLGTITLADGTVQATYQGHPLYTYSGDTGPGQTTGNGIQGTWHVALAGAGANGGSAATPSSAATTASGGSHGSY
ncbi:MAG TPA: hypothetical protein VGX23_18220 [Actinocrinis sp.]|nr:hypothetical protein [Actinocrinis sp.]